MEKRWDILSFGVVTVDDLYTVPQFPHAESKTPITSYERQGGGLSGTALVAAARLGARCAYAGVLGHDELSDYVLREFDREGVDCSLAGRRDGIRPIHSVIIVDAAAHTRTIFFNRLEFHSRKPAEISPELIEPARVLFVDHYGTAATIRALQIARAAGVQSVADIERDNEDPRIATVIDLVDHLIVSAEFAYVLTGQRDPAAAADALASVPRACTAVTCGADGCWYKAAGSHPPVHQPGFRVDVVDTTGCGDIFHGAYAAMIAKGCPIPDAIRRASAAAAIKAMHTGGRAGAPTLEQLDSFLARQ
ncbi:MAG TPA: PfkB family carbohydrate kinase [Phycisphaerae bacterium]|nr:PfkB family carbohydrate kinase [Phycisphaerae bacterium]